MRFTFSRLLPAVALLVLPAMAEAGPPLICHPFQTVSSPLLQWGTGPGWNTPDARYDMERLTADLLALLDSEAPVLSRMENMRRAVIYATKDGRVATRLLTAVLARASGPDAGRLAIFDAGYLVESYKQATHLFGRSMTSQDGYAMVRRALDTGPASPEMEFAAALMTQGEMSATHLRRARAAAVNQPLLAKNISNLGW